MEGAQPFDRMTRFDSRWWLVFVVEDFSRRGMTIVTPSPPWTEPPRKAYHFCFCGWSTIVSWCTRNVFPGDAPNRRVSPTIAEWVNHFAGRRVRSSHLEFLEWFFLPRERNVARRDLNPGRTIIRAGFITTRLLFLPLATSSSRVLTCSRGLSTFT